MEPSVIESLNRLVDNSLIEQYHYLGYTVGEHLKFLVYADERPVACFAWCSSAHYLGCRDRYLGWSDEARRKNIHLPAYNQRFLLLPWVECRYLASHLLARMMSILSAEWERVYGHRSILWKPSLIGNATGVPLTEQPTGWC